jgi:hypothetical protein
LIPALLEVPMSALHHRESFPDGRSEITRQDRAWFVKEARRRRNEEIDRLLGALGHAVARFARALVPTRKGWTRGHAS